MVALLNLASGRVEGIFARGRVPVRPKKANKLKVIGIKLGGGFAGRHGH